MKTQLLLHCVPVFAMLVCAAVIDLRARRIPNWLNLTLILSGLVASWVGASMLTPWEAFSGLLVGLALPFLLFAIRAIGGADVKLLAGVGAWMGIKPLLLIILAEAVIGMIIVLVQCLVQGRLPTLFRNSAVLVLNFAHLKDVGLAHLEATGAECRSVDRPLPYAVPVLLAFVLVVSWTWRGMV